MIFRPLIILRLGVLLGATAAAIDVRAASGGASGLRPNVVLIIADDLGTLADLFPTLTAALTPRAFRSTS